MDSRDFAKRRGVAVFNLELEMGKGSTTYEILYSPVIEERPTEAIWVRGDDTPVRDDKGKKAYHISLCGRKEADKGIGRLLPFAPLGVANSLRTLPRRTRECAEDYARREAKRLNAEFYILGPTEGPIRLR